MVKAYKTFVDELREKLAVIEHQRWADWQDYVHSKCASDDEGNLTIPVELVNRWKRQINTSYSDLTEFDKNKDREQVDRYWYLLVELGERK